MVKCSLCGANVKVVKTVHFTLKRNKFQTYSKDLCLSCWETIGMDFAEEHELMSLDDARDVLGSNGELRRDEPFWA